MDDVRYDFFEDCKDKKIAARSARNKKTHTGKGGQVRLPSDHLTKKEREAMNGECKRYRMNDPITWDEFKYWPKEHQETYIKLLRKKFNVPLSNICEMMGIHRGSLSAYVKHNKLNVGDVPRGHYEWDQEGFLAWRSGAKDGVVQHSKTPVDISEEDELVAVNDEPDINIPENDADHLLEEAESEEIEIKTEDSDIIVTYGMGETETSCETRTVIPSCGEMTFQGNVDDILRTISKLLDGRQVRLEVEWEVLG